MKVYISDGNEEDLAVLDLSIVPEVGESVYINSDYDCVKYVVVSRYWSIDTSKDFEDNPPYVVVKVMRDRR